MKDYPRVVQVGSLADFQKEVPIGTEIPFGDDLPAIVRLNLNEMNAPTQGIPRKLVALDLQGVNDQDEIVWLHYSQHVYWAQNGPAFGRDASIYEGLKTMHGLVEDHLTRLGYEVRDGRYGIPDAIKPLRGQFECVRWIKDDEGDGDVREPQSNETFAVVALEGEGHES
jgi:hypothetical protein